MYGRPFGIRKSTAAGGPLTVGECQFNDRNEIKWAVIVVPWKYMPSVFVCVCVCKAATGVCCLAGS